MKKMIAELKTLAPKIAELESVCSQIRGKLDEAEQNQSEAHIAERKLPQLAAEQEILRADIALGKDKHAALATIETEITKTTKEVESHNQLVAGLWRRLEETERDLKTLAYNRSKLVGDYVTAEAERIQAEYIDLADALLAKFRQLFALGHIYKTCGFAPDPFSIGDEFRALSIPVFQLKASGQWPPHSSIRWPKWEKAEGIASNAGSWQEDDINAEKARLAKLGLPI